MSAEQLEKMQQEQYALEQEIHELEKAESPVSAAEKIVAYILEGIEGNREPMIAKDTNEWSEASNRDSLFDRSPRGALFNRDISTYWRLIQVVYILHSSQEPFSRIIMKMARSRLVQKVQKAECLVLGCKEKPNENSSET